MRVGVVGLGKLGAPLAAVLASKENDVLGIDVNSETVRLVNDRRAEVLATYGAMGAYHHSPARDYAFTTSDGRSQVWYHEPSRTEVIPPVLAIVGGGFEQHVARRLAVRIDAQGIVCLVYPVFGARVSAGVSVPIGRVARD